MMQRVKSSNSCRVDFRHSGSPCPSLIYHAVETPMVEGFFSGEGSAVAKPRDLAQSLLTKAMTMQETNHRSDMADEGPTELLGHGRRKRGETNC